MSEEKPYKPTRAQIAKARTGSVVMTARLRRYLANRPAKRAKGK